MRPSGAGRGGGAAAAHGWGSAVLPWSSLAPTSPQLGLVTHPWAWQACLACTHTTAPTPGCNQDQNCSVPMAAQCLTPSSCTHTHSRPQQLAVSWSFPCGGYSWGGKAPPDEPVASFALCRRPSRWLSPSSHVLAVVVKGLAAEKSRAPEQPERKLPDLPQTHR